MNPSTLPRMRQTGLSLVELMIAMVIGLLLMLGVIQIFIASQAASRLSEGVARVQENGRFALDFLERDVRMVGHMGCVNDQGHIVRELGSPRISTGATPGSGSPLDFNVSVQGYEAAGTAPGDTLVAGGGTVPANLPAAISGLVPAPVAGSDILVLRFLAPEGVPVTAVTATTLTVDAAKWARLTENGVAAPTLFGVADCGTAEVFRGTTAAAGTVTATGADLSRFVPSPLAPTMVYRAESLVYYIGLNAATQQPGLRRARAGSAGTYAINEELVEGVENMQLLFGQDTVTNISKSSLPLGNITTQKTASGVTTQTNAAGVGEWRRVGQVQVGLILRSPGAATVRQAEATSALGTLGMTYNANAANDGRYRTTYEASIALRNRLFGN